MATGTATHVLTSNGAGSAPTFQPATGGSGATTTTGGVTHVTSSTDDFAIGGTTSAAPFFFDEALEDLAIAGDINVVGAVSAASFTADASDTGEVRLTSATNSIDTSIGITEGNSTDTIMDFTVEDSAGPGDSTYMELDGVTETVDILKPVVLSDSMTGAATSLIDLSASDSSTATEGLILPQVAAACIVGLNVRARI